MALSEKHKFDRLAEAGKSLVLCERCGNSYHVDPVKLYLYCYPCQVGKLHQLFPSLGAPSVLLPGILVKSGDLRQYRRLHFGLVSDHLFLQSGIGAGENPDGE